MRILNLRIDNCVGLTILVSFICSLLYIGLSADPGPILPKTTRKKTTTEKPATYKNTNGVQRAMVKPNKRLVRLLNNRKETSYQNIMKGLPLLLGSSYSHGRTGVHYVLGVPTVHRPGKNYLVETLSGLIQNMNAFYRRHCLIVVFIGETNGPIVQRMWRELSDTFGQYLDEGLIDVISPHISYYPDFDMIYITLHDEPQRVRWRTKQTLDYMYLMRYAQSRGKYYLQLEDDVKPNVGYLDYIAKLAALHSNFRLGHHRNWIVLSFCDLGFIGKLFHTAELTPFLDYVLIFYNDQPIDWLLQSYVKLRSCPWDAFRTSDCIRDYQLYFIRGHQSQFQHIGVESSLRDKEQKLKDKKYDKDSGRQRMPHLRQPFNLITSHKSTLLKEKLLLAPGETFVWGYMPQVSSLMRYFQHHQYDQSHFKIRSNPNNSDSFSELYVDLVDHVPSFDSNDTEMNNCGFIMSYTAGSKMPILMYYYMKEDPLVPNEVSWFRRFTMRSNENSLTVNWQLTLLWSLSCLYFI